MFKVMGRAFYDFQFRCSWLSQPTLSRVSNIPGNNANTDTINALCKYFKCTSGELLEFYPDENDSEPKHPFGSSK